MTQEDHARLMKQTLDHFNKAEGSETAPLPSQECELSINLGMEPEDEYAHISVGPKPGAWSVEIEKRHISLQFGAYRAPNNKTDKEYVTVTLDAAQTQCLIDWLDVRLREILLKSRTR